MDERHPALARLDALVGRWIVQPRVAGLGAGWSEFAWVEDGKFLRQFSDSDPLPESAPAVWRENNPSPPRRSSAWTTRRSGSRCCTPTGAACTASTR
ncbi:hypothetical protein ACFQ1L_30410 [Phytohabitans flavus]|uniref:hypothetical protein n=1 Tax=Phytohabitans flavus TaxID=1076124 RepID=UPI00363B6546